MVLGVVTALAAGACFAAGGVLQQRAAAKRPESESLSPRLILALVRQPRWLAGIGVAVLSYVFQATALSAAPLAVVQPLILSELLFAVPAAVRLRHQRLGRREWLGLVGVAAGLGVAIAAAQPSTGNPLVPIDQWTVTLAILVGITMAGVLVGRWRPGTVRAAAYALAAAVVMGLEAAFMAGTSERFSHGPAAGFSSWEPYAMAICSLVGLLLIQSAFQAGPLAASLPISDAVEPVVAIGIGLVLFGEHVNPAPAHLAATVAGIVVVLAGIVVVDTSPLVQSLQRQERS